MRQSGRVVANALVTSEGRRRSAYAFDTAGRLVEASLPGQTFVYGYGPTGCGAQNTGMNNKGVSLVPVSGAVAGSVVHLSTDQWIQVASAGGVAKPDGILVMGVLAIAMGVVTIKMRLRIVRSLAGIFPALKQGKLRRLALLWAMTIAILFLAGGTYAIAIGVAQIARMFGVAS